MRKVEIIDTQIEVVQYDKRGAGTQGYMLTPEVAKRFIQGAYEFIEPDDDYMEKPWKHGVKTYYFNPNFVCRANIQSTIISDRKNKKNFTFKDKLIIELFRLYKQILYKLYR